MNADLVTPEDVSTRIFSQFYRWVWILMLMGTVMLWVSGSVLIAANFAGGVGLSVMLARITQTLVQRYLVPGEKIHQQRLLTFLLIKLAILVVLCGTIILSPVFDSAGFMIGVGIVPILIVVFGVKTALKAS